MDGLTQTDECFAPLSIIHSVDMLPFFPLAEEDAALEEQRALDDAGDDPGQNVRLAPFQGACGKQQGERRLEHRVQHQQRRVEEAPCEWRRRYVTRRLGALLTEVVVGSVRVSGEDEEGCQQVPEGEELEHVYHLRRRRQKGQTSAPATDLPRSRRR
ncbi:hypothetical protein HPB51_013059 [Rhipicephalus microplus]|uniref:Uncharacterized protein n=1 Tax=Rhipicephalus microplus TaxID=6941 RepID=A0A9J6F2Y5_RHIMP|nr:hypothetical protein HPB51_013059 [Rhipicephalus microplus]